MGFLKNLKYLYKSAISGKMDEYKKYKDRLKYEKNELKRFEECLEKATADFERVKREFPIGSEAYKYSEKQVKRWKYEIEPQKLLIDYIRPNTEADIEYRNDMFVNYNDKLKEVLSPNLDLRFHGSPIYNSEQIIKSKSISSTADRFDGYISSTDRAGEISVSDINTFGETTLTFYSGMTDYKRNLPCGCIFAVTPKDEADAHLDVNLMHSINFEENPEQLFGIFTSPENIEQVKKWMKEAELNPDIVYTFEQMLEVVKNKSKEVDKDNKFNDRVKITEEVKEKVNSVKENTEVEPEKQSDLDERE